MVTTDTATKLLDHAQALVQERGFNAFSYKDLAGAVGIRTASIHYHFETKTQLGEALMARYLERLDQALQDAGAARTARARLRSFVQLYRDTGDRGLVCLCGSLASDIETLPDEIKNLVEAYLAKSEAWVAKQIKSGVDGGEFAPIAGAEDLAASLVCGLQGALFLSRSSAKSTHLKRVERTFWKALGQ